VFLEVGSPGILDSLAFRPAPRHTPRQGEMEIAVRAAGINFSDVLKAMGLYPGLPEGQVPLGAECAGIVNRIGDGVTAFQPGDEVVAVAPYSFARYAYTVTPLAVRKPQNLSFEEAATIPIAFLTAYYSLCHLGHMRQGERVLVHAATGGVGLAAIQLAHWKGVEVFATAGSAEKLEYLRSLGVKHVFSSRTLDFADEIRRATDGEGVDLVLNSLAGDAIARSLETLRSYGRFLEIGKIDIYMDKAMGLRPFRNNLSYYAIDLEKVFRERRDLVVQMYGDLLPLFVDGTLKPLPLRAYPAAEAANAFRFMAQRKHIGKLVVLLEGVASARELSVPKVNGATTPEAETPAPVPAVDLKADATYLITGGLGGLGLTLARWLAGQGARHLALMSRSAPSDEAAAAVRELEEAGVRVLLVRGDVAKEEDVSRALAEMAATLPPLRGVIHAAGVLDDGILLQLNRERFDRVLRPKVRGAWNLHHLTTTMTLDFFLLFSSVSSVIGSPGQGNYAAANAFLDSLAHYRRGRGLPCTTINWGPWAERGMAARADRERQMAQFGMHMIPLQQGVDALARVMGRNPAQVTVMSADLARMRSVFAAGPPPFLAEVLPPSRKVAGARDVELLKKVIQAPLEERQGILVSYFQEQLAKVLGIEADRLDPQQPLKTLGLDSLMGLEMMNRVQAGLGVTLSIEGFSQETNLIDLAAHLLPKLPTSLEALAAAPENEGRGARGEGRGTQEGGGARGERREAQVERRTGSEKPGVNGHLNGHTLPVSRPSPLAPCPSPLLDLDAYATHLRPQAARWLAIFGLSRTTFYQAQGDRLYYEKDGQPVEMLDFLGGFGSTLLGHNHPEMTAYARELLTRNTPVHAHISVRAPAGMLARALSDRLGRSTGRSYIGVLANTGTEVVEAAIKHAVVEQQNKARDQKIRDGQGFALLVHQLDNKTRKLPEAIQARLTELLGGELPEELTRVGAILSARNEELYQARPLFLALARAFHGKTLGSVQLTANPAYRQPFERIRGLRVARIQPGDGTSLRGQVRQETQPVFALVAGLGGKPELLERPWCNVAGLYVEPVQGEGGIHVLPADFVAELQTAAREGGFPIVADEIQSGLGRCGAFTASEKIGLRADYYTFAKSLGGGLAKVGALMIDRDRYQLDFTTLHTSTFAEDETSSYLALKALELIDRDSLADRCGARGEYLLERLRELQRRYPDTIKDVRGLGLMAGVELSDHAGSPSPLLRQLGAQEVLGYSAASFLFHEEGIRIGPTLSAGNILRLEPSAYISEADLDRCVAALERLCQVLERANPGRLGRAVVVRDRHEEIKDWRPLQPPPEEGVPPGLPQVTFLTHYIELRHLVEWDPSLAELPQGELERYVRNSFTTLKPFVIHESRVDSTQGNAVHLRIVCFPKTSAMLEEILREGNTDEMVGQIREAIEDARRQGSTVVGLGGYLSIIAHNCLKVATTGVSLTTGNALTVAMGLEAIKESCQERGIDLAHSRVVVVGATGNIGHTYTRLIAEDVSNLVLVGRNPGDPRLAETARQLYADSWERIRGGSADGLTGIAAAIRDTQTVRRLLEDGCPDGSAGERLWQGLKKECPGRFIELAYDLGVLAETPVIITATNSAEPIVYPEHLAPGQVVICDLAVPADVSPEVAKRRPDVTVLRGGIVRLPENSGLTITGLPLPPGHLFACLAETVLLGLEGHKGHFSFGPITREQVVRIGDMADRHGYEMGQLQAEGVF